MHLDQVSTRSLSNLSLLVLHLLLAVTSIQSAGPPDYTGYQVYRLDTKSQAHVDAVLKLSKDGTVDVWKGPFSNRATDVLVSPANMVVFKEFLKTNDLAGTVSIEDVKKLMDAEASPKAKGKSAGELTWDAYYTYAQIAAWVIEVNKNYPNLTTLEVIGKTHEGRDIQLITITATNNNTVPKPEGVFIDGGFHAREWISPATSTYIINELTQNSEKYQEKFLSKYIFYIVPVVNPDGYEFTHTDYRLWRKNRAPTSDPVQVGVDLNRNFPISWGGASSSKSPDSQEFMGASACSELECLALTTFILAHPDIVTYITLHSYGQWWLYPYSYEKRKPANDAEFERISKSGTAAIKSKHGTKYTYGSSAFTFSYAAAGCSDDWSFEKGNVSYAYTLELRSQDSFILPPSEIIPSAEEAWFGIQYAITRETFNDSKGGGDDGGSTGVGDANGASCTSHFLSIILLHVIGVYL